MSLVLDAGAFIAIERGDREVLSLLKQELLSGRVPITHGGILGQVWRSGRKQAILDRFLRTVRISALDEDLGRRAGVLLGRACRSDVMDAAVVLLATDGDSILTSDTDDLRDLAEAARRHVDLVPV